LLGQSSDTLVKVANQIVPTLANIEGLTDVKTELDSQKYELQLQVDRQKAYRFGLNVQDIANIVATALRGSNLRTFRHSENGEVGVKMMFDEKLQHSVEELKRM